MFQVDRVCAKVACYDKERADWFDISGIRAFSHLSQLNWTDPTVDVKCNPVSFTAVQVNSVDQRLRVFDPAQRRWRQVCSSPANDLLASISCEEVGFVR